MDVSRLIRTQEVADAASKVAVFQKCGQLYYNFSKILRKMMD